MQDRKFFYREINERSFSNPHPRVEYRKFEYINPDGKILGSTMAPRNLLSEIDIHHIQTQLINSSPPGQNGRHFADDIFKHIFLNENVRIFIQFSLEFVPKGLIDNRSSLV